jgi:hypothetical protein
MQVDDSPDPGRAPYPASFDASNLATIAAVPTMIRTSATDRHDGPVAGSSDRPSDPVHSRASVPPCVQDSVPITEGKEEAVREEAGI